MTPAYCTAHSFSLTLPPVDPDSKLRRILFEPDFALNAQAFGRKSANFPQDAVIAHLVNRIEEIAGAA